MEWTPSDSPWVAKQCSHTDVSATNPHASPVKAVFFFIFYFFNLKVKYHTHTQKVVVVVIRF